MANFESLALLGAVTSRWSAEGGGFSGNRLTRSEMAGLLKAMQPHQLHLVMAKYCDDARSRAEFVDYAIQFALDYCTKNGWISKKSGLVERLGQLAAFELISPNRCRGCKGRGHKNNKVCTTCQGSGFKRISGYGLSELLGIDNTSFRKTWRHRYDEIFKHLQDIETEVGIILNNNSKGGECL